VSNYQAIATVTSALQRLILQGLQSAPWGFNHELSVTVSSPESARSQERESNDQINIFLFQATPSTAWRNEALPSQGGKGEAGLPPLALNLYYLITAYAPNDDGIETHRLLGRALSVLHDHVVLSSAELQAALPHSDVHEQVERIRLVPHILSVEEMSKLWSIFQKSYRLSAAWQASVVLIDSNRPVRAPLPVLTRGFANAGISVQPDMEPPTPGLESVTLPHQQASARLGEVVTVSGHRLAGETVRVSMTHSRWSSARYLSPSSSSIRSASVILPSGSEAEAFWPAGMYVLSLAITRHTGEPEFITNELPFTLAPVITSISPSQGSPDASGGLTLTVTASPQIRPDQRVSLLVGDREFKASARTEQTATLTFRLHGLSASKYRLRLRVDGVDSLVVDKSTTPPSYAGPELELA
jgi:hypothetical protein